MGKEHWLAALFGVAAIIGLFIGFRDSAKGKTTGAPVIDYLFGRGGNPRRSRDPYYRSWRRRR